MIERIHIFGATGSGTTTLGKALADKLGYTHFDNDHYVFETKNNRFTRPRQPLIRDTMLFNDLKSTPAWILSGAICGWGDFVIRLFDLVVFLWVPLEARMKRIEEREEKLGRKIEEATHPQYQKYKNFLRWASEYDTGNSKMRSLAQHEKWMEKLTCPVLRVEGNSTVDDNAAVVMEYMDPVDKKI